MSAVSERPLAAQLARQVLADPVTHGWLAPLAREYLKEIGADRQREKSPLMKLDGETGKVERVG